MKAVKTIKTNCWNKIYHMFSMESMAVFLHVMSRVSLLLTYNGFEAYRILRINVLYYFIYIKGIFINSTKK